MALSTTDLEKIKYFLGYTNLTTVALAYADIPAIFETVIQNGLSAWAETQVTGTILPNLVQLDVDIYGARSRYKALSAGEVKLNPQEHSQLLGLRDFYINQLEHVTGMKRNAALAIGGGGSGTEVY